MRPSCVSIWGFSPPSIFDRYKWSKFIFPICSAFRNLLQDLEAQKIQFALFTPTAYQSVTQIQVEPTVVLLKGLRSSNYLIVTQNSDWAGISLQFFFIVQHLSLLQPEITSADHQTMFQSKKEQDKSLRLRLFLS